MTHRPPGGSLMVLSSGLRTSASVGLLLLLACGGGGGGSSPTAPPPQTGPSLVFTAAVGAGANSVFLVSVAGSTDTRLLLSVMATEISDVYAVAFDLEFPNVLLRHETVVEGDLLSQGMAFATSLQVVENPPGHLVVGLTRLGVVAGASGSGDLLTLEFTAIGEGSGPFTFEANDLFDPQGSRQPEVTWSAGSVNVNL